MSVMMVDNHTMTSCDHQNLTLIPQQTQRVQCRHCHLTIKAQELGAGYCPECYETSGRRRYDFDEVELEEGGVTQYRCDSCGVIINCD